ncbi:MAG: translocation/assembly module TamB domain-containing protein, partial [Fidelibacterota bacterium]
RTLLGEIEGIADMKLSVTGKDTVSVAGDIVPRQAVLRIEFSSEEDYSEVVHEGPRTTHYLVHFPIESNVMLRNSQIDAELSGDITIQKMGSSPIRYSGELDLLSGKFYYYSDVFDIQEGHLVFDPSEFNPRMDIHATTTIQDIDIGVSLTGTFEEPIMLIEDSEQYYSQSQLLQLLTIQKQFNEQDLSTRGLGDQSVYLFGRFLESELERSLVRSTPLLDEFEIEGSSSLLSTSGDRNLALKVGTRFSPNLYLSYKQSFSLTEPSQVGVEYRLSPNVSWVVKYDDDGYMHLKFRRKYKF